MQFYKRFLFNTEKRKSYYTKLKSLITSGHKFDQSCFKIIKSLKENDIEYLFSLSLINQFKSGTRNFDLSEFLPDNENYIFHNLYEFKNIENLIDTLITITEIKETLQNILSKSIGSLISIFLIPILFYAFFIFANDIGKMISVNPTTLSVSSFFYNNIYYIYGFLIILFILIFISFDNYNGKMRKYLNYIIIYRIHTLIQSIIFFNVLVGLIKSNIKIVNALKIINLGRKDYISKILINMISNINNGENFGKVLINEKFPTEKIAHQINIISETQNIEIFLEKINTDIKISIISEIESILTKLQMLSLVLIGTIIIVFITSVDTQSLMNNMNF